MTFSFLNIARLTVGEKSRVVLRRLKGPPRCVPRLAFTAGAIDAHLRSEKRAGGWSKAVVFSPFSIFISHFSCRKEETVSLTNHKSACAHIVFYVDLGG